jgi:addiction module RelE/StbE family toxin
MNRYSVEISDPARQDIVDIVRYISAELNAQKAAQKMFDRLYEGMKNLENNPKRHTLVRDERLASKDYRTLPVKNYLVFYTVEEQTQSVNIIRVLYARRDWTALL